MRKRLLWFSAILGSAMIASSACNAKNDRCSTDWTPVADLDQIAKAMEEQLSCTLYLELPEGTFEGTLTIRSNVHLRGAGKDRTFIEAPAQTKANAVLQLSLAEKGDISIERLGINAKNGIGIAGQGKGTAELSDLAITVYGSKTNGGVGIHFLELADFDLHGIGVVGNVTETNAGSVNASTLGHYGLEGIVIENCAKGSLQGVSVSGFAWTGVRFNGAGSFVWSSDTSSSNKISSTTRVGLMVANGATLTTKNLSVSGIYEGGLQVSGFGVAVLDSSLTSESLQVSRTGYVGVFADHSPMTLNNAAISDALIGLWSQKQNGAEGDIALDVTGLNVSNVRGIGLGVHSIGSVSVKGGTITNTSEVALPAEGGDVSPMGDGIQVLGMTHSIKINNFTVADCQRAGMVIDPAPGLDSAAIPVDADFTGTSISGNGERGFVMQKGSTATNPVLSDTLAAKDAAAPATALSVKSLMTLGN